MQSMKDKRAVSFTQLAPGAWFTRKGLPDVIMVKLMTPVKVMADNNHYVIGSEWNSVSIASGGLWICEEDDFVYVEEDEYRKAFGSYGRAELVADTALSGELTD